MDMLLDVIPPAWIPSSRCRSLSLLGLLCYRYDIRWHVKGVGGQVQQPGIDRAVIS